MINSLKGFNDLDGLNAKKYLYFIDKTKSIVEKYGFNFIKTPILEETSLFKRSVGNSSDIVNKEMYNFNDKNGLDICLRPEGTAGLTRYFIENKLDKIGNVNKFYYFGSMFRYEKPQKGRLREFTQLGCESFGISNIYEDANILIMIKEILDSFNISFTLKLNSLGCTECMPKYRNDLYNNISNFKIDLCEDCNNRLNTNPIRILDCKNQKCQSLLVNSPKITNCLCDSCNNDFETLKNILIENNVSFEIDTNLVRGLDYYNKTAFEFISNEIGAQSTIVGGGRYDKLIEYLGGKSTSAIGFAIGIERLLDLITLDIKEDIIYVGSLDESTNKEVFKLSNLLRKDFKVFNEYESKKFKKQFSLAEKYNANIIILLGENEINTNTIYIKNLINQKEFKLDFNYFKNNYLAIINNIEN